MEPFEIRTTPARLSLVATGATVVLLGLTAYILWLAAWTTVLAVRHVPRDRSQLVLCAVLLLAGYVLTWIYLRMFAPSVQLVLVYLVRDRGKAVVAHRLDESGWHRVLAGADVVVPWPGMSVAVTERTDDRFDVQVRSDGPYLAARDPLSRRLRRDVRKGRGFVIPMTTANPTEDELADAVDQQSGGRVFLAR